MIERYEQSPDLGDYSKEGEKMRQEMREGDFFTEANQIEKWAFTSPLEGLKRLWGRLK